jgi:ubiquinone biosynthesis protein COQ9
LHKEAVRRAATLFALPIHAPDGAKLVWGTADAIWNALGDTSRDYNWYTKRAILSGVYSSTTLFWLGDQSEAGDATWKFLDRRIEDVMRFEKTKSRLKDNKLAQILMAGPKMLLSPIRAPGHVETGLPVGLPGRPRQR